SVGFVSPATRCRTVLLPDPLGPMMVQNCRAGTCSESPRKASTRVWPSPKTLLTLSNRIIGAWRTWDVRPRASCRRSAGAAPSLRGRARRDRLEHACPLGEEAAASRTCPVRSPQEPSAASSVGPGGAGRSRAGFGREVVPQRAGLVGGREQQPVVKTLLPARGDAIDLPTRA